MKGYGLFYYIGEAFRGLRANSLVNLLAMGTIIMSMLIVGFFLLVFFNIQAPVLAMGDRFEMSLYLRDGLTQPEKDFLLDQIKAEPGIRQVRFLSKDEALQLFRRELQGQERLLQGLGDNPLPDSFELTIDRQHAGVDRLRSMARKFAAFPGVEDATYGREGAEVLSGLLRIVTWGGLAVAVLIGIAVVFIVSNSVRLALYSRGQEIELMQWIGATRGFIQGPFLLEGMFLAMIGTALAVGMLAGIYYALPQSVVFFLAGSRGLDFLSPAVVAYMIAGGGLLGLIGASISVGRFLD